MELGDRLDGLVSFAFPQSSLKGWFLDSYYVSHYVKTRFRYLVVLVDS